MLNMKTMCEKSKTSFFADISQVKAGSIAEKVGLKVKDSLVKIGNDCALDYTIEEAHESLKRGKDFFDMIVER